MTTRMGSAEWALLATLSLLWGGSFYFVEVALADLPPLTVVLLRVALAGAALLAFLRLTGRTLPRDPGRWAAFAVMGAANNAVPFALIVWGQTRITGGLAAILNATTPLFAVVLAHFLARDERLGAERVCGVLLGLTGVAAVIGPSALDGLGAGLAAELAVLGAAASYACAGIFGRRFAGLPPAVTAAGQLVCSTLLLLPLALVADRPWTLPAPSAATLAALLALATLSTAAAYVVYFRLLAAAGATNLLLVTFLIPVTAVVLGTLLLGEHLEAGQLAGMAVIALGLAAVDGRPARRLRAFLPGRRRARPARIPLG